MRPLLQKAWLVLRTALLINAGFLALLLIGLLLLAFTPIYKLAGPSRAVEDWEQKTKGMSDIELLVRLEDAIKLATEDGSYWKTLKTAEEQYPGRYSPESPPPYWNKIQRDFDLGCTLGLVQRDSRTPYDSLTRRERLLLCSFDDSGRANDLVDRMTRKLGVVYWGEDKFVNEWLMRTHARMDVADLPDQFQVTGTGLSPQQAREWLDGASRRQMVSPVAGTMLRMDAAEFAPGQAYVECYFLDSEWERLLIPYMQWTTDYSPQECRDHGLVYYRIYGEKDIIAEGVRAMPKAGRYYRVVRESIKQGLGE